MRRAAHFASAAAAFCALAGVGHAVTGTYNRLSAIYPAGDPAHGKALAASCLVCHGENGPLAGDPPYHAPKLRGQHAASLFYALDDYRNGSRKSAIMAPMAAGLSDQDMRDLAVFLAGPPRARGPGPGMMGGASGRPPAPDAPGGSNATLPGAGTPGHAVNRQVCTFCHGRSGEGVMDGVPVIGGQYPDYLTHALADYRSGARTNATMAAVARQLTPEQQQAVIAFLAGQPRLEVAQ